MLLAKNTPHKQDKILAKSANTISQTSITHSHQPHQFAPVPGVAMSIAFD